MKSNLGLIRFRRTDVPERFIEHAALEIAEHFSTGRDYAPDFCRFLQNSKFWNVDNLDSQLDVLKSNWDSDDRTVIVDIIERAFRLCKTNDEIHGLRGAFLEGLVLASYGDISMLGRELHWGAQMRVFHNGRDWPVKYYCLTEPQPSCDCGDHSTVDVAYWNGFSAEMYECKLKPGGIGCKEKNYSREVLQTLNNLKVHHRFHFVTTGPKYETETQMKQMGVSDRCVPIGYRELGEHLKRPVRKLSS